MKKGKLTVDRWGRFSVGCLLIGGGLCLFAGIVRADDRIDLRLNHKTVSYRMTTPRLALGTLKEKEKETELQVKKKRVTSSGAGSRVTKKDRQRKKKTKRVIAAQ